jgi:hypothetical protein
LLLAFDALGLQRAGALRRPSALAGGFWLALALYTYFAARALPLIILAWLVYVALFHRTAFWQARRAWLTLGLTAIVLSAPLAWAIARTPGGEARLSVVGRPLQELLAGQPAYAVRNMLETFGMAAFTGDPEALYNIPNRPLFEPVGAALWLAGVLLCLWRWRDPRYAFNLIWLVGGLAPAFVSTPSASLGHTIAAQPVMYLLPALALTEGLVPLARKLRPSFGPLGLALGALLWLGLNIPRDLRAYFVIWPALPEVRDLYRADLHAAAADLRRNPSLTPDVALTSRMLHQADGMALQLEAPALNLQPRLFNPQSAWVIPAGAGAEVVLRASAPPDGRWGAPPVSADFARWPAAAIAQPQPQTPLLADFVNGWQLRGYTLTRAPETLELVVYWRIGPTYQPPPPRPLAVLSGSPSPLRIFSHLIGADGQLLSGADRLEVDPATVRAGDNVIQRLSLALPTAPYPWDLEIGLYNPSTGERTPLTSGPDHLPLITFRP